MKLKEALVKAGKIDASENKRGRPSAQYIAWAKELVAQGWVIDGFSPTAAKPAEGEAKPAPEVKHTPTTQTGKVIADVGEPIHDEREWEAVAVHDGKTVKVGMRTVCNNSHTSLTYCPCGNCRVNLDYNVTAPVNFRGRKEEKASRR